MSWYVYAVLTIVLWGAVPLIDKVALRSFAADTGLCVRAFTAGVMLLVYAVWKGKFAEIAHGDAKAVGYFMLSAVLASVVAQYTYFAALQRAEASRLVPFTATYPLVAAVLAILLLHEPLTLTKLLGAIFIVGGLMLVGVK